MREFPPFPPSARRKVACLAAWACSLFRRAFSRGLLVFVVSREMEEGVQQVFHEQGEWPAVAEL